MSRQSIEKANSIYSFSSFTNLDENGSLINEAIYHKCHGKIYQNKISNQNNYEFNQDDAELIYKKSKSNIYRRIMILMVEMGIRLKIYKYNVQNYKRTLIPYKQIQKIYNLSNKKHNVIILGIIGTDNVTKVYECIKIKDFNEFKIFENLLNKALNDPDKKLVGVRSIGNLSLSSIDTVTNPKLRGSINLDLINNDENIPDNSTIKSSSYPNIHELNYDDVHLRHPNKYQNGEHNKQNGYNSGDHSTCNSINNPNFNSLNSMNNVRTPFDNLETHINEPILTPIFNQQMIPINYYRTSKLNDDLDTNLFSEKMWPGGVTFLELDNKYGPKVVPLGPVYLYCERIQTR